MRVVHLIHSAKIGGVETAAALLRRCSQELNIRLLAFAGPESTKRADSDSAAGAAGTGPAPTRPDSAADNAIPVDWTAGGLNNPLSVVRLLAYLRRAQPEVLVTSLWRSVAVGLLARPLLPRTSWVVYLHNCRYTNLADMFIHTIALTRADAIFCDSQATRAALVPARSAPAVHVVRPAAWQAEYEPNPASETQKDADVIRLLFWGRLARQKRLDRAVDLLAELHSLRPGRVRLDLLGPDEGQWEQLHAQAATRGVENYLNWHGRKEFSAIAAQAAAADFFVQLSDFEGLGMAAREAMQLGLVPVLTPVGEIPSYARDGHNAICSSAPTTVLAQRILKIHDHPALWQRMSDAARTVAVPDFVAEFTAACKQVSIR